MPRPRLRYGRRTTEPDLFIIESLDFESEQKQLFEGKFLSQILRLGGKKSAYYYFRTKKELQSLMRLFQRSDYRYLHLSCHGGRDNIETTLDTISFPVFAAIVNPYLSQKRFFISACSATNADLAEQIIPSSKCLSIIGPAKIVYIHDAAIVWASFYHLMFKEDMMGMDSDAIRATLRKVATTFKIPLNYFFLPREGHGFKGDRITITGKITPVYPLE